MTKRRLFISAGLVAIILLLGVFITTLQTNGSAVQADSALPGASNSSMPGNGPQHIPVVEGSKGRFPGIYVWDGPYKGLLPYGNENLGTTFPIRGMIRAFNWGGHGGIQWGPVQEPNTYSFGSIDSWLKEMCNRSGVKPVNRKAAFYIMPYDSGGRIHIPTYMYDTSSPWYAQYGNAEDAVVEMTNGKLLPKYWTDYYLEQYRDFIIRMSQKYRDKSDCIGFIGIGTGRDGETWPVNPGTEIAEKNALIAAGLTSQKWVHYVEDVTDVYVQAFTGDPRYGGCDGGPCIPLMLQAAPYFLNANERKQETDYAAALGVGDSNNGLYPDQEGANFLSGIGQYDPIDNHWQDAPMAFETYGYMLSCYNHNDPRVANTPDRSSWGTYWAMLNGLDKHIDYLRPYVDLLLKPAPGSNPADSSTKPWDPPCQWGYCNYPAGRILKYNVAIFDWASQYLGVTEDTTPSVWVALREHRTPWFNCVLPKDRLKQVDHGALMGNFNFWLYQDDSIPGGQTVPETNELTNQVGENVDHMKNNFNPYNPDLPYVKEAWYIRRTDEGSGNPYMFFNVDDGYIYGGTNTVTVTVTYIDMYTDTWSLQYDARAGLTDSKVMTAAVTSIDGTPMPPGTMFVQKEGTKAVRTAVFVLHDARFHNYFGGRADFRLNSNGDGDEWIHMVDVQRGAHIAEPTPTPTPTPTITPTATPSPTATPTTAAVNGTVWVDENADGLRQAGEPPLAGAVMQLWNGAKTTIVMTDTSDASGQFSLVSITPGDYDLVEAPPAGYQPLFFAEIPLTGLQAGQVLTIDFANKQLPTPTPTTTPTPTVTPTPLPATITGIAFDDTNGNGARDSGEAGLAEVVVKLYKNNSGGGGSIDFIGETSTLADGTFQFLSLTTGSYTLAEVHPYGYLPSGDGLYTTTLTSGEVAGVTLANQAATLFYVPDVVQ